MGVNKAILLGNLGMDPELRHSDNGSVLRLRLATNERWRDKDGNAQERTEWHTVVFFGKRADGLARVLRKGESVYVEGRIQTRTWEKDGEKRYSTEIVGTELEFTGGGSRGASSAGGYGGSSASTPAADDFGDDEIPF